MCKYTNKAYKVIMSRRHINKIYLDHNGGPLGPEEGNAISHYSEVGLQHNCCMAKTQVG